MFILYHSFSVLVFNTHIGRAKHFVELKKWTNNNDKPTTANSKSSLNLKENVDISSQMSCEKLTSTKNLTSQYLHTSYINITQSYDSKNIVLIQKIIIFLNHNTYEYDNYSMILYYDNIDNFIND